MESYEESDYIFDDYDHVNPGVFYSVTRIPGSNESKFQYFESGCNCTDSRCTEENSCSCLKYGTNYRFTDKGLLLVEEKFGDVPVFECNIHCSCFESLKLVDRRKKADRREIPGLCPNRNVQFGPAGELEIFSAGAKGLGLRTKRKIPAGHFICEYAGEVIELEEAKKRQRDTRRKGGMNYVFILKEFAGDNLSNVTCVDPTHVGNLGRYINHSCQPNSAIVPVRVNDSVPWLCVFARRDIEEGEEICYDYSGRESDETSETGDTLRKPCLCGAAACKGFLPFQVQI